jgi:hypothetical protein
MTPFIDHGRAFQLFSSTDAGKPRTPAATEVEPHGTASALRYLGASHAALAVHTALRQETSVATVTKHVLAERASAPPPELTAPMPASARGRAGRVAQFSAATTGLWAAAAIVSVVAAVAGSTRPSPADLRPGRTSRTSAARAATSELGSSSPPGLFPLHVARDAVTPPGQVTLFTDAKSGLWAAATTAFCVAAAAAGNLALLAASLGSSASPTTEWRLGTALAWGLTVGAPLGVIVGLLRLILPVASRSAMRQRWGASLVAASVATAAGCMFVTLLYGVAWRSAVGSLPFAWQPVVGLTMSVVAMASFGGYYLASRRSRVGFAASFVLTFFVLLSFMLTLDGLARVVAGSDAGDGAEAAAKVIQDLLSDFRTSVALIVGFYFGTDAAVSVVKMFRTSGRDPEDIARLDRDLAVPHPGRSGDDAASDTGDDSGTA